jgi:2-polyprenyl-6-methoxyphenol hydroxylase-like FAD-dependent oxidoreductase
VTHRLNNDVVKTLFADLVVDSSGRGSRSPAWLEKLGFQRPVEDEIHVGVGYTSCFFDRQPNQIPGLEGIVVMATPPDKRTAVLTAQDGNRWVVTIGGYLNDHAPTDMIGFLESAKNLPTPDIHRVIRDAQPINSPVPYKFASNLRRRYEKLENFPEGYLVFGDALCSFNPIYAQGMTVAAMEAAALKQWLNQDPKQSARNFFRRVTKIIDLAWSAAVGNDLSYPEIEGPRTPMTRFFKKYMDKLHFAAHQDAQVSIAFLKMINMVAPPSVILHPKIIWRVLKSQYFSGKRENQTSLMPVQISHPKKS